MAAPPPISHAHHPPPPHIRLLHKKYQKASLQQILEDRFVLDLKPECNGCKGESLPEASEYHKQRLKIVGRIPKAKLHKIFRKFERVGEKLDSIDSPQDADPEESEVGALIYEHASVPGLQIIPSLLPPSAQAHLLSCIIHRDLANPLHKTNIHAHYNIPYPTPAESPSSKTSFFNLPPESILQPLDRTIHKPITLEKTLEKKLRWMTLGGQYDWTKKEYPEKHKGEEIIFPPDIGDMIKGVFPKTTPQAAIANFYSPGDTLSAHRDVSESSSAGLVSISIGCDAIFLIGLDPSQIASHNPRNPDQESKETEPEVLILRIRSGDAILMDRESRWAWHSVPKIVAGSCPGWLEDWPADGDGKGRWKGWMKGKRVNLNVRQMWD
ncbi:hypothetical protein RUND412_008722 [Rhizina undulata]